MTRKEEAKKAKIVASSQGKSKPVLYDDIIFTILSHLPATCLHGIVRYVCNTWAQLIRSPHFVDSHLQRSRPGLFLQQQCDPYRARFLLFKENGHFEITNLDTHYPEVVECSLDGLLVFPDKPKNVLYVSNPIIKDVVEVPLCLGAPQRSWYKYGMAQLPNNGGLKLVCVNLKGSSNGLTCCYALTLGVDDSWRKIGSVSLTPPAVSERRSITIGHFIYWVRPPIAILQSPFCEVVLVDTVNESVFKFSFPERHSVIGYMRVENYFSYVQLLDNEYNIYVSKDVYIGNWEIYHKIVYHHSRPNRNVLRRVIQFIACVDQDLIIFMTCYRRKQENYIYFAYNMKTQQITSLEGHLDANN